MKQLLVETRYRSKAWLTRVAIAIVAFAALVLNAPQSAGATGVYEMPNLTPGEPTWVVDEGNVLSRLSEGKLASAAEQLRDATDTEMRFVTIHRLDYGETVQSFTDALFEKWFPTPEQGANQILVVVDTVTNNSAIHVGEGVGETVNAAIAESIASETIQVPLRQDNKYNQAFLDASDRISAVVSGQPDPGPPEVDNELNLEGTFTSAEDTDQGSATVIVVVLLLLATVIPMATYYWYQSFGN